MVLGRLGCRPHPRASALSCPSPFAGRGSHTSQAGYGAPALYNACIVGRVVLPPWLHNAAFTLCPLCLAQERLWCDHDYPRWGGHTTDELLYLPRARRTGFYHRVGAFSLLGSGLYTVLGRAFFFPIRISAAFTLPHPDKPCSYQDDQGRGYPSGCPGPLLRGAR
jgi:hypothetical protein